LAIEVRLEKEVPGGWRADILYIVLGKSRKSARYCAENGGQRGVLVLIGAIYS
jgi:hypothetical protein